MRPNKPLEEMLAEALDAHNTACILADEAEIAYQSAIDRTKQTRKVVTAIHQEMLRREKEEK